MLATGEILSLREAADVLGIEPWRLSRLGRYLGIDAGDKCVPRGAVHQMAEEASVEQRYCVLRQWLLDTLHSR